MCFVVGIGYGKGVVWIRVVVDFSDFEMVVGWFRVGIWFWFLNEVCVVRY